jgi:predicted acyltransferase
MTAPTTQQRLVSLDVFRGATIALMILVNNPGSWSIRYSELRHAAWNGWTMTDMVFPFFLWIMGLAMTFSFAKRKDAGTSTHYLIIHALRRSAIIFALGILLNAFPFGVGAPFSFATLRIPGVLQRIAICYFVAAVLFVTTSIRVQLLSSISFLAIYWLLMKLVPVPGYGSGILEPVGNLGWYIDSLLLGRHAWAWAPAQGFDPEGIISTIPAFSTTMFGVLTGYWLRSENSRENKTVWMFVSGFIMILAGATLDRWFPINKNLWTPSYAVFMGGWALLCFSMFYWLLDVKGKARWLEKLTVFGVNAIVLYVVSELLAITLVVIQVSRANGAAISLHEWIYLSVFASWLGPLNASLAFAIVYIGAMYFLGWVMWKKKLVVKV